MISRNGIDICISTMPYRKKPCLCVKEGNTLTKVASFNNEETAKWFSEKIETMFEGMTEEKAR